MPNAHKLLTAAVRLHQEGQLALAKAAYIKLLRADKSNIDGLRLLGCLYLQLDDSRQAHDYLLLAHKRNPGDAEILNNLGIAARNLGKLSEAEVFYQAAIKIKPSYPQALHNLGSLYYQQGKTEAAVGAYREALRHNPDYAQAHYNLGNALRDQNLLREAIAHYERSLELEPEYSDAIINLALTFAQHGATDKARAVYEFGLRQKPDHVLLLNNYGNLLRSGAHFAEAKLLYDKALKLQPDYVNAHINLGTVMRDMGQPDAALAAYQEALRLKPDSVATINNLGTLMQDMGRLEESSALYDRALVLEPGSVEAQWNKSLVQLSLGDYETGWKLYDSGLGIYDKRGPLAFPLATMWDGQPFIGKRLLITCEQGLGDALQFIRYAALCKQRGGEVCVLCPHAVAPLFENDPAIDKVFTKADMQDFDVHIPMMSLPRVFGTVVETIPATVPYLFISDAARAKWAPYFATSDKRLKVGLVWAGGIRDHQPLLQLIDGRRSMQLSQFLPLFDIKGVAFYNLQIGPQVSQIEACGLKDRLIDLTTAIGSFEDTAALVEHLDLVIAVDTSIVHLVGGLGKPVWVLSRFDACWRWLRNKEFNPWYPSARIFGQMAFGQWGEVVDNLSKALKTFVEAGR